MKDCRRISDNLVISQYYFQICYDRIFLHTERWSRENSAILHTLQQHAVMVTLFLLVSEKIIQEQAYCRNPPSKVPTPFSWFFHHFHSQGFPARMVRIGQRITPNVPIYLSQLPFWPLISTLNHTTFKLSQEYSPNMMPRLCLLTSFVLDDKCLQLSLTVPRVRWTIHQILPSEKEKNEKMQRIREKMKNIGGIRHYSQLLSKL